MDQWQYKSAGDFGLPMKRRLLSVRRESGLISNLTRHAWWLSTSGYLRTFHRLRIRGREHLPMKPPFVMVANHSSHLDIMMMAAGLPLRLRDSAYPIAAGDTFFETPGMMLFSWMMLSALPMWRKKCMRHAIEDLRTRLLEEPVIYILFPEGTRTRDGEMGRFKPGLGMLVAETDVPVVPCHIRGAFQALPSGRSIPRPHALRLAIGEPLSFREMSNDRAGWNLIASRTRDEVEALVSSP